MSGQTRAVSRIVFLSLLAPLAACSTTTSSSTPPATQAQAQIPVAPSSRVSGFFAQPTGYVDPNVAEACTIATANKYFLPTKAIRAMDTRPGAAGGSDIVMQVDLRSAICSVSSKGVVRNVVDTTPKSADQVAAEAAYAKAQAAKAQPAKAAASTAKK